MLNSYYWIGLEKALSGKTYSYYLSDGTYVGNGYTSNANPYAHFGYAYQDTLTGYQATRNCTMAHSSYAYDQVGACGSLLPHALPLLGQDLANSAVSALAHCKWHECG